MSRLNGWSTPRTLIHTKVYFWGLCLFLFSLSFSRFLLTLSLAILATNWIAEGNLRERFRLFVNDKPALLFTLTFSLSLLGVLWAESPLNALSGSLYHKLPTLLLPIIMVTSKPLSARQVKQVIHVFIGSVVAVTLIGVAIMVIKKPINFREASPFVPATNFCMLLVLAAFQFPLLIKLLGLPSKQLYVSVIVSLWLVAFVFYLRSFTGVAIIAGTLTFTVLYILKKHRSVLLKWVFASSLAVFLALTTWLFVYMYGLTHNEQMVDISKLPAVTAHGAAYEHHPNKVIRENGHLVYLFIADSELQEEWVKRSNLDYNGNDKNNEPLKHTLYRYMASKGLTKDRTGFSSLTPTDIKAVEDGTTNHLYNNWPGFFKRAHTLMMGLYIYTHSPERDPTWSTFTERFDLWRASLAAFKVKPWLGWGTGQIARAVEVGLASIGSPIRDLNIRSHNQYLSLLLLWGVVGATVFLMLLVLFVRYSGNYKLFIFSIFIVIIAVNGLVNDPLEGQVGQNLFAFFCIFYYHMYPKLLRSRDI